MTSILAIDTSSAWCSVALSFDGGQPQYRHEAVSAGASQLLLPWVDELLKESQLDLKSLSAIAVGVGPGAFTGVRLGVASVQGLAISCDLPVIPVSSLDAIAAQLSHTPAFIKSKPTHFVIAIDARMDEVYWAKYETQDQKLPIRLGDIHLSHPEEIELVNTQFLAGSAIKIFGDRLFTCNSPSLAVENMDSEISVSALGVLDCARQMLQEGRLCDVHQLEPLYVRNKVALTTAERLEAYK